jgi:3-oxoacyl-[acyl-carrier-protein] synthase II
LFINYALEAADEALKDASIAQSTQKELDNIGVSIGSGIGSIEDTYDTSILLDKHGYRKVSPFFVPRILVNMAAGAVCIKYGFRGPNHCVSTACAAGLNSIGDASRFIQYGDADVMLAGGTEACITPIGLAGFARLRGLSTKFNNEPSKASRPFDSDRDGFVIGEGAGIIVLEEYEHAKNRGAKIYAELVGYGTSADAHHITTPPPDGKGAVLAMTKAIKQAGISPDDVGYINAHATSTPQGDLAELLAIGTVFKSDVSVSSFKGHLGHSLGAAGAIETVLMLKALKNNLLPPTLNLDNPEKTAMNLKLIQKVPLQQSIQYAVKNSFGFGGTNCSLVFKTNLN